MALVACLCAAAVLTDCGGTGAAGTRHADSGGVGARAGVLAFKVQRAARAGRTFSASSIWNKRLSKNAALDPHSAEMVAALDGEVSREESEDRGPWINTTEYGLPILTVPAGQPTVAVGLAHSPEPALSAAWSAVPLPADAKPAQGGDGDLAVWQPSSDRLWEFWQLRNSEGSWQAAWGGAIEDVSHDPGVYGPEAWPGAQTWWGVSASSLALAGGAMTIEQLQRGRIGHALVVALPEVRTGAYASPAQRTDGTSSNPLALPEGARLRLDPHLNLAGMSLSPLVHEMALAAQRYGILVSDYAANIAFLAQDPRPTGSDPYTGPDGLFEGKSPTQLLASFPWSHLQVMRMELHEKA